MPQVVHTIAELRQMVQAWHAEGLKVAVVPTMGALHGGHLTLVREGFAHADRVVVTVFVNPKQFAPTEDLSRYPRDLEADVAMLETVGTHLVYAPDPATMYAAGFATTVSVNGPAKAGLEDKFRPQFFEGVATVVAKLFIQSQADVAIFLEVFRLDLRHMVRVIQHDAAGLQRTQMRLIAVLVKAQENIRLITRAQDFPGADAHLKDGRPAGDRGGDRHERHDLLLAAAREPREETADGLDAVLRVTRDADDGFGDVGDRRSAGGGSCGGGSIAHVKIGLR